MLKILFLNKKINKLHKILWFENRKVDLYCKKKDWDNVSLWLFKKKSTAKALNKILKKKT